MKSVAHCPKRCDRANVNTGLVASACVVIHCFYVIQLDYIVLPDVDWLKGAEKTKNNCI